MLFVRSPSLGNLGQIVGRGESRTGRKKFFRSPPFRLSLAPLSASGSPRMLEVVPKVFCFIIPFNHNPSKLNTGFLTSSLSFLTKCSQFGFFD